MVLVGSYMLFISILKKISMIIFFSLRIENIERKNLTYKVSYVN